MRGMEVFAVAGTDENGLKIKEAAEALGRDPNEFVQEIAERFIHIFDGMGMKFDAFMRTSLEPHKIASQALFAKLQANGYIYTATYEGWYDVSTETYFKADEIVDGKSPDGNVVRWVSEENYFFKLSAFGDRLLKHIEENPDFIIPETRKNEVVSFIKSGLHDQCISRKNNGWGIPVPGDESQVIYVWFDALINYITATGWPEAGWEDKWNEVTQWLGKDILVRFHATLWPAMLMGADLPLPKHIIAHAWILLGGEKISKSKGNVVTPLELVDDLVQISGVAKPIAIDALRFYLASHMGFENDSKFTYDDFYVSCNSDLANKIGNALQRIVKFVPDGRVPTALPSAYVVENADSWLQSYMMWMNQHRLDRAARQVVFVAGAIHTHFENTSPWNISNPVERDEVVRTLLFLMRILEGMIRPFSPHIADEISKQLGAAPTTSFTGLASADNLLPGSQLGSPSPIFPRILPEKVGLHYLKVHLITMGAQIQQMEGSENGSKIDFVIKLDGKTLGVEYKLAVNPKELSSVKQRLKKIVQSTEGLDDGLVAFGNADDGFSIEGLDSAPEPEQKPPAPKQAKMEESTTNIIGIEDFAKVQLKVGRVLEAEFVEGSDKLLKLQVVIGAEKRQIVAGIRANYTPEDLIGRQVVVVVNLKPAKLRGVESQGMLLAATDENGGAILLQPDREAPEGTNVR
jgi:methionyl-tRNA synthetase